MVGFRVEFDGRGQRVFMGTGRRGHLLHGRQFFLNRRQRLRRDSVAGAVEDTVLSIQRVMNPTGAGLVRHQVGLGAAQIGQNCH